MTGRATSDWRLLPIVWIAAVVVGAGAIHGRPELTRSAGFIFGDEAFSTFVASELLRSAWLYRDVAYPYGFLPAYAYAGFAALAGNTPVTYLWFLLLVSVAGLTIAYLLLRRFVPPRTAALVTTLGLMPVFVIPGSLLGGFISSYYIPVERALLLLAALWWTAPAARSRGDAVRIGAVLGTMQVVRFGTALFAGAGILLVDAVVLAAASPPIPWRRWLRGWVRIAGVFAIVEAAIVAGAFGLLPGPIAADVVWPRYMLGAFTNVLGPAALWDGWKLFAGQYLTPAVAVILTIVTARSLLLGRSRDSEVRGPSAAALLVPAAFFVVGAIGFFRTPHHVRQFMWTLVIPAAWAMHVSPWWRRVAIVGWMPVLLLVIKSAAPWAGERGRVLVLPDGARLTVSAGAHDRIQGIADALTRIAAVEGRAVTLFHRNGSGFYASFGIPHVGRTTWFFPGAVRPHEEHALLEAFGALTAVVVCRSEQPAGTGHSRFPDDFPRMLADDLERRVVETVWRDESCTVLRLARRTTEANGVG